MKNPPVPGWHDTRSPQPVHISAYLEDRRGRHRVLITAYSALGLILDRAPGLELDERVTVELRSGDRLPTRVVWVRRAKARVRFLGSIAQGHPVPQLLEEAAIRHQSQHTSPAAR
jgi:hypothetical protein